MSTVNPDDPRREKRVDELKEQVGELTQEVRQLKHTLERKDQQIEKIADKLEEQIEKIADKLESKDQQIEQIADELESKDHEIEKIADIHQALLPRELPQLEGFALAASHVAPERAGGDYYDFLPFEQEADRSPDPAGPWWIVIADASGHGPAAAVIMAMMHSILHAYSEADRDPGKALRYINKQMTDKRIEGSFVTALLALVNPAERSLAFACAGHPPPLVKKRDGRAHFLNCDGGGPPLGVDPHADFGSHMLDLKAGEVVLFYTDGAFEADDGGREQFGMERLRQALAAAPDDPSAAIRAVNRAVAAHRKGERQDDDATLVALRLLDVE